MTDHIDNNHLLRFDHIQDYRVFRDYQWPEELYDFARMNVIYGWNGSGKTSISTLMTYLQHRKCFNEGQVKLKFRDDVVYGGTFDTVKTPDVRVFNAQYIRNTITSNQTEMGAIYYIGEHAEQKQQEMQTLKSELENVKKAKENAHQNLKRSKKSLDKYQQSTAKNIKELLLGSDAHKNYDKTDFYNAVISLPSDEAAIIATRSADEKKALQEQRKEQPKAPIARLNISVPDCINLKNQIAQVLSRTVIAQRIDALSNDADVSRWVKDGLALHTGKNRTDQCIFCKNLLSDSRLSELQAHFNDEYQRLIQCLEELQKDIKQKIEGVHSVQLPRPDQFYSSLAGEFSEVKKSVEEHLDGVARYLNKLLYLLDKKKNNPFVAVKMPASNEVSPPDTESLRSGIDTIAELITRNGQYTENLKKHAIIAATKLEEAYVADAYPEFQILKKRSDTFQKEYDEIKEQPDEIQTKIMKIEEGILENRTPAEELNADLQRYLNHDELRFEVKDRGYTVTRAGHRADNLSEGEKTAVALLYFLKSLEDRDFQIEESIVVIDDPVSSLDANNLFNAFAFIKERVKACGQLFLFTHNFAFLRQIKNWFYYLNKSASKKLRKESNPHPPICRFFVLENHYSEDGKRMGSIAKMDPLLAEYQSEYHYLFSCVYRAAQNDNLEEGLKQRYGLPNIARRLLESFLSFKRPSDSGNLFRQIESLHFGDGVTQTRILRFLHTFSHNERLDGGQHDLHLLSETPQIMKDVLDLMRHVDATHYDSLVTLVES